MCARLSVTQRVSALSEGSNPHEISSALGRRGTFLDLAKLALIKLILWGDAPFSM